MLILFILLISSGSSLNLIKQNGLEEELALLTKAHLSNQSTVSLTIESLGPTLITEIHAWVSTSPDNFKHGISCPYLDTFVEQSARDGLDVHKFDVLAIGDIRCGDSVYFSIRVISIDITGRVHKGWAQGSHILGGCQFTYARMFRLVLSPRDCLTFEIPSVVVVEEEGEGDTR